MKKKISIIIAALVVLACAVAVFFIVNDNDNNTTDTNTSQSKPDENSDEAAKANASVPSPEEIDEEVAKMSAFDDAHEVDNFTKEDVQEVIRTSVDYANNSMANVYFIGGHWVNDGMPNVLNDAIGRYYTDDIRERIAAFDTNPDTGKDIGTNVMPLVFYLYPNGNITANDACALTEDIKIAEDGTVSAKPGEEAKPGEITCPMEGVKIDEIAYVPTLDGETPGIMVTFSATTKIPVTIDGDKDGYSEVTYDYKLNFVSNENYEEDLSPNKFLINWYETNVNMSAVVEL